MSLCTQDLIHLPYDDSLTTAGITYACRSLNYTQYQIQPPSPHSLRRIVASIAAELALRRWLEAECLAYNLIRTMPFTQPDQHTVTRGGRRLEVHSTFIAARHHIRRLRRNPSWLLEAQVDIPIDQFTSEHLAGGDLYVFVFLLGLETHSRADLARAQAAHQPFFLIAVPPSREWRTYKPQSNLGRLDVSNHAVESIHLELGGQLSSRQFQSERLTLAAGQRVTLPLEFASINFLHPEHSPSGAIVVHSHGLGRSWKIDREAWANIWIYGLEILLAGWCTKGMFNRDSSLMPRRARTWLGRRNPTDSRAMPMTHLKPMVELIKRARQR
jgi:hypothetical protein